MSNFSIADAKSQFAQLVNQAEAGQAVRNTRRGKRGAVLVNDAEYERLSAPREGLIAFTNRMHAQASEAEIELFSDAELKGLRDQSARPALDLS
jgi:prevent-host-death family protein